MGFDQSDHSNALPPRVQPGDIILVHAGVFPANPLANTSKSPAGLPFENG
jgi:hypothetical protein